MNHAKKFPFPAYFISLGALTAMIAVVMGAFGAHALKDVFSVSQMKWYQTAFEYQMAHSLALILLGLSTSGRIYSRYTQVAGISFLAGMILFSGSLYLLAFTQLRWLGAITPIGGLAFISGWLFFALAARPVNTKNQ